MTKSVDLPLVTVVVTCFNKASYIEATVRSALRQSYPLVQLIVVDDGSEDESGGVIAQCLRDVDAQVISLTNGGVSRARNLGASAASDESDFLLFLDGDDLLEPNAIEKLVAYMTSTPEALLVYSIPMLIDEAGMELGPDPEQRRWSRTRLGRREVPFAEPSTPLDAICSRFGALPSGSLIRRSAFNLSSGWDSNLCRPARPFHVEDKDMAIQIALLGAVHRLPECLFRYRVLPTPHRSSQLDGLWELNTKWWNKKLVRPQRSRIRKAIRFDYRVTMLDMVGVWVSSIRGQVDLSFVEATKQLVLSILRWIVLPVRLRVAGSHETR